MLEEDEGGFSDEEGYGASSPSRPPLPDEKEDQKVQAFSEGKGARRRSGVSAASVSEDDMLRFECPVYPKSAEETAKIKEIVAKKEALQVLFGHLAPLSLEKVVGAMFMRNFSVDDVVIQQGADGDYFYIVDSGQFDIFVQRSADTLPQKVMTAQAGGSFGELALMYNVPRAATVKCVQPGGLWCLERKSFQMLLVTTESRKEKEYEGFLAQLSVCKLLNKYELAQLSDLLEQELYDAEEAIIEQDQTGDAVFFLYDGECKAYINGEQGELEVKHYTEKGEYFGEVALVKDVCRQATVRAKGDGCVVLKLKSKDVDLSIGSLGDRLRQTAESYPAYEAFLDK